MKSHKDTGEVKIPLSNVVKPTEIGARKCYKKGGHIESKEKHEKEDIKMEHQEERKHGGSAKKHADGGAVSEQKFTKGEYEHAKDGYKKDGKTREKKNMGGLSGGKPMSRLDRPARKSGGLVGADKHPFTTAANIVSHASASK